MYIPKHFAEPNIDVLHQLIRAYPLATLVTNSANELNANHIPVLLSSQPAPFGTLRAHVARANPLCHDINDNKEVLAIFHGVNAYITPSWYPTKAETGKVVPTWNYVVAHAYGKLRIINDPNWLRAQLQELTAENEAEFPKPWQINDAPPEYIEKLINAVVGIEIEITRLFGKWKTSQNQPNKNQTGVINGLRTTGKAEAAEMANIITEKFSESN